MKTKGLWGALVAVVVIAALAMSGTMAWAVATDYSSRGIVPAGVTIAGRSLAGMTEVEARQAIAAAVSAPMMRPITVRGDGKTWTLDPAEFVSVDLDAMVAEAYSTRRSASLVDRLRSSLQSRPLPKDVKPAYSVDTSQVAEWVATTAKGVDRRAKDSSRTIVGYAFKVTRSAPGVRVDQRETTKAIVRALAADRALSDAPRTVKVSVIKRKPKVTESSFGRGIIVSLSRCRIYLYDGGKLVKSYPCAPGMAAWPTPTGDFHIVRKLANAPWYNPHSTWSANMPDVIGPGPGNPMGVRKIGIDVPGVYMHGIPPSEFGSIGTHASHGCMRMFPSDVLDLYGRVEIDDPVFIRD